MVPLGHLAMPPDTAGPSCMAWHGMASSRRRQTQRTKRTPARPDTSPSRHQPCRAQPDRARGPPQIKIIIVVIVEVIVPLEVAVAVVLVIVGLSS